ncbi:MAG: cupin domain-containing protein [Candidatus Binatia bacterium]
MPGNGTRPVVVYARDRPVEGWDDPTLGRVVWWTLLSGDRTPTDRMTVGIAEIGPDARAARPHRHAPPEVYHILAGEGVVVIDGVEHPVSAGATVFIPGNAWHGTRHTGVEPLRLLYVFAVDAFADVAYEFAADEER